MEEPQLRKTQPVWLMGGKARTSGFQSEYAMVEKAQEQHMEHVEANIRRYRSNCRGAFDNAHNLRVTPFRSPEQGVAVVYPHSERYTQLNDQERMTFPTPDDHRLSSPDDESIVQYLVSKTSWVTWMSLGLCSILAVTSVLETPVQDVLTLGLIGIAMSLFTIEVNSAQMAAVALMGLVLSTFNIKQMFFAGLLGAAGYLAIAREGLLYYVPRPIVLALINSSVLDMLEQPFTHPRHPPSKEDDGHVDRANALDDYDDASSPSSLSLLNPFAAFWTLSTALNRKGLPFALLPGAVRWALLPGDMRERYERRRARLLGGDNQGAHNQHQQQSVVKTLIHLENKVSEMVSTKVNRMEHILVHNPAVESLEKIAGWGRSSVKEALSPSHKEGRVGALFVLTAATYIAVGWMRTPTAIRPYPGG